MHFMKIVWQFTKDSTHLPALLDQLIAFPMRGQDRIRHLVQNNDIKRILCKSMSLLAQLVASTK